MVWVKNTQFHRSDFIMRSIYNARLNQSRKDWNKLHLNLSAVVKIP